MIVRHWSSTNGSGMHHAAKACAQAERLLGIDSELIDIGVLEQWEGAEHADIHVLHTDVPESFRAKITRDYKMVFVAHGTPEHVMEVTVENHARPGYGIADGWGSLRHLVQHADAVVTFWPRHQWFYQTLVPKERQIRCIPLGVDVEFWKAGTMTGKFAGSPSVWTSENQARIKWCLDLLMCWPEVLREHVTARLHAHYIPFGLHRFFIDLANSNGAAYGSYLSSATWKHEDLRSMWKGLDFFLSPVRYGDHNCVFLQAAATGIKTISYRGNEYADFWITEGDQRAMAQELVAIFKGQVEPRTNKLPVPTLEDMGKAMIEVYRSILPPEPEPPTEPEFVAGGPTTPKRHRRSVLIPKMPKRKRKARR